MPDRFGGELFSSDSVPPWLAGAGDSADVVLSSRVRLARNLANLPFLPKSDRGHRLAGLELCRAQISRTSMTSELKWIPLHECSAFNRLLLVERHLISKQHSKGRPFPGGQIGDDPRAVAYGVRDERLSIMVNEEDHLRLQVITPGLSLGSAWRMIDAVDDQLEQGLDFAFSGRFGYLTACATNVGTGLRMSAMLHLPGLRLTGDLEKVKRAAQAMSLAVRGFYGEGSEAAGDFFQISNQTTLGRTEEAVLADLDRDILPKVVEYERIARRELLTKRRTALEDQVFRARGTLMNARLLATDEAMQLLSMLRLGVVSGLFTDLSEACVNQLMLLIQPAHLQRELSTELDQERRRVERATLVRNRLAGG
jgi:protein arginine kinase